MRLFGGVLGVALGVVIIILLPGPQDTWLAALIGFVCGGFGTILGVIADEVAR